MSDISDEYSSHELVPDHIFESIFSYLSLKDIRSCSLVCKTWYRILNDENNDVWRLHCMKRLAEEVLKSDLLSTLPTYKSKLRAFCHSWNPYDCSRNIYVKPNGFTLHRFVCTFLNNFLLSLYIFYLDIIHSTHTLHTLFHFEKLRYTRKYIFSEILWHKVLMHVEARWGSTTAGTHGK